MRKMFYFDQPDLGLSREFLIKGLQAKEVQVSQVKLLILKYLSQHELVIEQLLNTSYKPGIDLWF